MNNKTQTKTDVKVKINFIGQGGNAFYILGTVIRALRQAGYNQEFLQQFQEEAMEADYTHLLATVYEYVIVESVE